MQKREARLPKNTLLSLTLLGGFDASVGGNAILDAGYAKLRGLLALLAMSAGTPLRREFLAELLWPEMPIATARQNLRLALFNLKSSMGGAGCSLSTSRNLVTLSSSGLSLDVAEFIADTPSGIAQLERKISLYQGEFMAGFYLPDCLELDDWLLIQRETMQRRALALLERLATVYEQAGDYRNALQPALRYLELDSWDEHAHRRVMRLYALSGSNSSALAQFDMCCKRLKHEMGALPSEETRQLAERIRSGALGRPVPSPPSPATTPAQPVRLQVTVLYCELSAVEIEDPDDAMALLRTPQARCMKIIQQFSGYIVQTHGGGLLAYFGYPQADEHAACNAVHAALAVARIGSGEIEIRAGVHTGLIITNTDSATPDTVGKTSRLAIQLRQHAAQNEVAISRETQNIVGGYFDCISLGRLPVPGTRGTEVFRVTRESGARTRLEAASRLTPFTGREAEIAGLMKRWEKAAQGKRQVVLLRGEAGIGKSRLLHALKQRLAEQAHEIRELRCFPKFRQSPFHPVIELLGNTFAFTHNDAPSTKSAKLAHYIEAHYPALARHAVPLLCRLFSLPMPATYAAPTLSPQKLKEQTLALLLSLLQALATRQPTLLIAEDLHWCDPSTLEMLSLFVEQNRKSPVFAIFTARPVFVPPWTSRLMPVLNLAPLDEQAMAQLISLVNAEIPPALVRSIVQRADGMALFGEEMARVAVLGNPDNIPSTLQDLLAARMAGLGKAKSTAQLASAIGREFDLHLLSRISPLDKADLASILDELLDSGLVLCTGQSGYQFKHALIQEAIYQSQLKVERQAAHKCIAQVLMADFSDIETTQPELLAQHLAAAGETRQAVEYWLKAGQRAALHSANTEAVWHFNGGLQLLPALDADDERDSLEIKLRLHLGTVLVASKGFGSVDAGQAFTRALELSEQVGDQAGLYQALWGMWLTSSSRSDHAHSLDLAEKLLHLAQQGNDILQLQQAHYAVGNSQFWTGDPASGRLHLERSMALYQPSHHELMVARFGENTCISSGALLLLVLWLQGYPDQAEAVRQQTVALARQVNHPFNLGYALSNSAMLRRWLGQPESSEQSAQECMEISDEFGLPFWHGMGAAAGGWAMAVRGQESGIAQIQRNLDGVNVIMSGAKLLFLAPLCEALLELGKYKDALGKLDEALAAAEEKHDRFFESEFHRLKGECLLKISPKQSKEAEACFDRALAISRKQGAKSLELRAAMSLTQLWQQQGRQEEAQLLLEGVYSGFSEGFATRDLQVATCLLGAAGGDCIQIES